MEPNLERGVRYRQPPRPPVRPFPNPMPQREGLVKRLPTWSSRRAVPHSVPDAESGAPQAYKERSPDLIPEQVPGGMFGKIVANEEPAESPYPFHYDIPPPMPYTNCPKEYVSRNITRRLPIPQGPLKIPKSSPLSSSIPSSVQRSNPVEVPVQSWPAAPPPPPSSIPQQIPRQAPPPPPGPPPTRPAPPPPSRPPSSGPTPAANSDPVIRRTRRLPLSPGIRPPPTPPPHARPPQSPSPNIRAPTSSLTNQPAPSQLPPDHPLLSSQAAASSPDIERAFFFRNKLAANLEEANVNNPELCPAIQDTITHLDGLMEELRLARTDDEFSSTVSALEGIYEYIQTW